MSFRPVFWDDDQGWIPTGEPDVTLEAGQVVTAGAGRHLMVLDLDAQAALDMVGKYLHVLSCERCGGRWIVRQTTWHIFHNCRLPDPPPSPVDRETETQTWARRILGPDLEERLLERESDHLARKRRKAVDEPD